MKTNNISVALAITIIKEKKNSLPPYHITIERVFIFAFKNQKNRTNKNSPTF